MSTQLLAPPIDIARATRIVQKGLPWNEAEFLAHELGLTLGELADLVGISLPTFFRRRKQKRFHADESDHLMRFARLWSRAIDVFENDKGARDWLKQPALGLGGRRRPRPAPTRLMSCCSGSTTVCREGLAD